MWPLLILLVAVASACTRSPDSHVFRGETMGTRYTVKVTPKANEVIEPAALHEIRSRIEQRLEEVNSKMSTYREDSELSRFNAHHDSTSFEVSAEILEVFRVALKIAAETDAGRGRWLRARPNARPNARR